jgi:hypothetical protein
MPLAKLSKPISASLQITLVCSKILTETYVSLWIPIGTAKDTNSYLLAPLGSGELPELAVDTTTALEWLPLSRQTLPFCLVIRLEPYLINLAFPIALGALMDKLALDSKDSMEIQAKSKGARSMTQEINLRVAFNKGTQLKCSKAIPL